MQVSKEANPRAGSRLGDAGSAHEARKLRPAPFGRLCPVQLFSDADMDASISRESRAAASAANAYQ